MILVRFPIWQPIEPSFNRCTTDCGTVPRARPPPMFRRTGSSGIADSSPCVVVHLLIPSSTDRDLCFLLLGDELKRHAIGRNILPFDEPHLTRTFAVSLSSVSIWRPRQPGSLFIGTQIHTLGSTGCLTPGHIGVSLLTMFLPRVPYLSWISNRDCCPDLIRIMAP